MKSARSSLVLFVLLLVMPAATGPVHANEPAPSDRQLLKYEEPRLLTGRILARDGQLLFRFRRLATRSGSTLQVQRDFNYPNGQLAARERVVYEGDELVSYNLEETQTGGSGSARIRPPSKSGKGTIEFHYSASAGAPFKDNFETLTGETIAADMVGTFLASHWDALQRGERVTCRYLVVPRRETVGFTFAKVSDSPAQVIVRMEPSSRFLRALVDPLTFTMEKNPPHRVLQYAGRTTPKVQQGRSWSELDAVTVFDW